MIKYMVELINKYRKDGSMKSKAEIEGELKTLLHTYRRQNLLLHDRLFNIQNNILPKIESQIERKDKIIEEQKDIIKKLKENENKREVRRGWFFN